LEEDGLSLYDALVNKVSLSEIIRPTNRQRLSILPAAPELAAAEVELAQMLARETLLQKALKPILPDYDFIFIDTPPSLGGDHQRLTFQPGVIISAVQYLPLEGRAGAYDGLVREVSTPICRWPAWL
jgi:chromosome partitioning protein